MKKQTQSFQVTVPFTKTEPINGKPRTTKYFDLVIHGEATLTAEQDIDGSWDKEYDFEIEEVKYQESGKPWLMELPNQFLWFADLDTDGISSMITHSVHHSFHKLYPKITERKTVKDYIMDHIEDYLDWSGENEPEEWNCFI